MWPFKPNPETSQVPTPVAAALIISVISLAASLGVARWSWILLDEQVQLRKDFMDSQNSMEQLNIQFDYWDQKVTEKINELREMKAKQ